MIRGYRVNFAAFAFALCLANSSLLSMDIPRYLIIFDHITVVFPNLMFLSVCLFLLYIYIYYTSDCQLIISMIPNTNDCIIRYYCNHGLFKYTDRNEKTYTRNTVNKNLIMIKKKINALLTLHSRIEMHGF